MEIEQFTGLTCGNTDHNLVNNSDCNTQNFIMSLDNMEYNMLLNSLTKRTQERQVPMRRLITLLVLTSAATVGQLALAQLSHCITLLTLVHQNIYNALTILVSVLTQWKNEKVSETDLIMIRM